ncbi:MAG: divalent metal cation transporter, partial [Alphaproteobacteria bacterium]|nr:divalent metal cation transporter [Alphaproteobacteria bacterium]
MAEQVVAHERESNGFLRRLGPGLITGASDDDPSGIGTYSQVGAQFGYGMAWTMPLSFPLMAAIQEISARIGRVTGRGIAGNIRRHYPPFLLHGVVLLVLVANIINLGADLGAMGDVATLLIGGPRLLFIIIFGTLCAVLEVFVRYERYVRLLKWTTLSLFAYVATAFVIRIPWLEVARNLVLPHIAFTNAYVTAFVAVMGTTISPYLFFWQSSEEAANEREDPQAKPLVMAPSQAPRELRRIRIDTYVGMAFSNVIALCIIVTTAATLNAAGVTDIASSAQAAEALRPLAGPFAFALFGLGIIGTGLLAVPVLAGSAAYALGEARKWPTGLARLPHEARAFYATIAVATVLGIGMNFMPIDPIKALFWSAVVNGVVAVPVMVVMMIMAAQKRVMGQFAISGGLA